MDLTDKELKRALQLQRRLKTIRWFSRWFAPWTNKIQSWRDELQLLYNKKFTPDPMKFAKQYTGNPLDRLRRKAASEKEITEIMRVMNILKRP